MARRTGFTLIELLVVVALIAIVLMLGAPSLQDFILVQRLKGVSAQVVTDLQLARSEATTRNAFARVAFGANSAMTCYTIYTLQYGADTSVRCDCLLGVGTACTSPSATEVRTVQVPSSGRVFVRTVAGVDPAIAFDHLTGGLLSIPLDDPADVLDNFVINTSIDASRTLRTTISRAGRPSVCAVGTNLGAPPC